MSHLIADVERSGRVNTMRAVVQDRYGSADVLKLENVERPSIKPNEVLVRVRAAAVNPLDWFCVTGGMGRLFFGISKPKVRVRGVDVAGIVDAVGEDVKVLRPGDEVYGGCRGSFAEYTAAREVELGRKPANLSFEQAAAVPVAAITALQSMRDAAGVQPGQKVLINGAAGGVGSFAVQIARALGAEVTGVCSTRNVDLVSSLGAAHVIDYTRDDFTRTGQRYDVILDNVGNHSWSECRGVLTSDGTYMFNSGKAGFGPIIRQFVLRPFVRQKLPFFIATINTPNLDALRELIEAGTVTPTIDCVYPLDEAAKAVAHVGGGHARGKVVITI